MKGIGQHHKTQSSIAKTEKQQPRALYANSMHQRPQDDIKMQNLHQEIMASIDPKEDNRSKKERRGINELKEDLLMRESAKVKRTIESR